MAENTPASQNIGTPVSATDPDAGDTTLTYTLSGADAASFGIVATSGQLQTKDALDHETKDSYSVTVTAKDGNGGTVDQDVTITVTNENDPPAFAAETGTRAIAENTEAGQPIGDPVEAEDPDAGDTTLTYTLGGADVQRTSDIVANVRPVADQCRPGP